MKCVPVGRHEAEDIDRQVRKILRGLGDPEPPLQLAQVRELLRLDRQFYSSSTDSGTLREYVSRLKVAGKQILANPMLLWDAIKKADLSALYIPDKRLILLDTDKPKLKHRWNEGHEISHSFIEWHVEMSLGDTDYTLRPECHEIIEAEANYAAGRLLFLQDRFVSDARDVEKSIQSVRKLANRYGNTVTSTLWRFAESVPDDVAVVALVSCHPRRLSESFNPNNPCRYCVPSIRFQKEFSHVSEVQMYGIVCGYCGHQRGGPLGSTEVCLRDNNGVPHLFYFESFFNGYEVLTLGVHRRQMSVAIAV